VGLSTLQCAESSYFDVLFSGRWQQALTEEGEVFIDRDGEVFKHGALWRLVLGGVVVWGRWSGLRLGDAGAAGVGSDE